MLKPGHIKILLALDNNDGLRKENLAKAVGDRTLAVKYRRELLRWGLIRNDEFDRFHLTELGHRFVEIIKILWVLVDVVYNVDHDRYKIDGDTIEIYDEGRTPILQIRYVLR